MDNFRMAATSVVTDSYLKSWYFLFFGGKNPKPNKTHKQPIPSCPQKREKEIQGTRQITEERKGKGWVKDQMQEEKYKYKSTNS